MQRSGSSASCTRPLALQSLSPLISPQRKRAPHAGCGTRPLKLQLLSPFTPTQVETKASQQLAKEKERQQRLDEAEAAKEKEMSKASKCARKLFCARVCEGAPRCVRLIVRASSAFSLFDTARLRLSTTAPANPVSQARKCAVCGVKFSRRENPTGHCKVWGGAIANANKQ